MDKQLLDEILERVLGEAAGTEHERLKAALITWAKARGYHVSFSRLTSGIPDVLLGTDEGPTYLCVGDAKDSANETADVFATWERIRGYVRDFAGLIREKRTRGGVLAIATNTMAAAQRWVPFLNAMAESARLSEGGNPPNFTIATVDAQTLIVWW
ncbi:MAG: hypothetical protein JNK76_24555 [Planctomycetales bacterium]|nr:hypothetical protein [Planctomycetales bacterium]MBN8627001.1 hypothetical protein [Planctomycetota bacterium]